MKRFTALITEIKKKICRDTFRCRDIMSDIFCFWVMTHQVVRHIRELRLQRQRQPATDIDSARRTATPSRRVAASLQVASASRNQISSIPENRQFIPSFVYALLHKTTVHHETTDQREYWTYYTYKVNSFILFYF